MLGIISPNRMFVVYILVVIFLCILSLSIKAHISVFHWMHSFDFQAPKLHWGWQLFEVSLDHSTFCTWRQEMIQCASNYLVSIQCCVVLNTKPFLLHKGVVLGAILCKLTRPKFWNQTESNMSSPFLSLLFCGRAWVSVRTIRGKS